MRYLFFCMQEATSCPDYPVTDYSIVLEDSEGHNTVTALGNELIAVFPLMEDLRYSISVITNNTLSSVTSAPVEIGNS